MTDFETDETGVDVSTMEFSSPLEIAKLIAENQKKLAQYRSGIEKKSAEIRRIRVKIQTKRTELASTTDENKRKKILKSIEDFETKIENLNEGIDSTMTEMLALDKTTMTLVGRCPNWQDLLKKKNTPEKVPEPGNGAGLSGTLGTAGKPVSTSTQSRRVGDEERKLIEEQEKQRKAASEPQTWYGKLWKWITDNWGWLLAGGIAIAGAIFGVKAWNKYKDKKAAKKAAATLTETKNTVTSAVKDANTVVSGATNILSGNSSVTSTITYVDKVLGIASKDR